MTFYPFLEGLRDVYYIIICWTITFPFQLFLKFLSSIGVAYDVEVLVNSNVFPQVLGIPDVQALWHVIKLYYRPKLNIDLSTRHVQRIASNVTPLSQPETDI